MTNTTDRTSRSSLLLFTLLLMFLALMLIINFQPDNTDENVYTKYRAKGDSLYQLKKYDEALPAYEDALLAKPYDRYTEAQIAVCQGKQTVTFQKQYGTTGNDVGKSIVPTRDGGYLLVGTTTSYGNGKEDAWLLKIDEHGTIDWRRTYGGKESDVPHILIPTPDQEFLIVGKTHSSGNHKGDAWAIKVNERGRKKWEKTYGSDSLDALLGACVLGQHYYAAGLTVPDSSSKANAFVVKLDSRGDTIWTRSIGGEAWDMATAIAPLNDTMIVITGHTRSYGNGDMDFLLAALNEQGDLLWQEHYGSVRDESANTLTNTANNTLIAAGFTTSSGRQSHKALVLSVNADGSKNWQRTMGKSNLNKINTIFNLPNKNFLLIGTNNEQIFLSEMDVDGKALWQKTVDALENCTGEAAAMTRYGGFIVTGSIAKSSNDFKDVLVIKTDQEGNF